MVSNVPQTQGKYYIGLMSGTSADGIDLALVDFTDKCDSTKLVASFYQPYNTVVAEKITSLYQPGNNEVDRAFHLDIELAHLFSQAITALLLQEQLSSSDIIAIGNHGQTIRHRPSEPHPFTLQIGCCQTLATLTGIRVIGQFRRKDMALGGQGAPLVPIFHQHLFKQKLVDNLIPTFVVNIGGIANITFLPEHTSSVSVLGFDTGPGNALLDDWFLAHHKTTKDNFDKNGSWAASGTVNQALLTQLLTDEYLKLNAPKSTGREYFNLDWLHQQLSTFNTVNNQQPSVTDIQATLLSFTAQSISNAIKGIATQGTILLCGGGVHNKTLVNSLNELLKLPYKIKTMQSIDVDGDSLEAMAFAWLAYAYDEGLVSNMPAVTGAKKTCTLGSLFLP